MNTIIIVQARMTSTRLPGKVLKKVLGKTLLEFQIERLKKVSLANNIVIATTTNKTDDPIIEICKQHNIATFRGDEQNVLSRYFYAAQQYNAQNVVRVTSDCPLIDPEIIDAVIQLYKKHHPFYDFVSNCIERTYPRGMDTEVFSFKALHDSFLNAHTKQEQEHVTPFIREHKNFYKQMELKNNRNLSHHRWTVDTSEDFTLIKHILENIYPNNKNFTIQDILDLFEQQPKLFFINSMVQQKHV